MQRTVFWKDDTYVPGPALSGADEAQVLIIGGGIAGLMAAHELLVLGMPAKDIVILEGDTVGSGSTGHSAGMLVAEAENEKNVTWHGLAQRHGLPRTRAYYDALLSTMTMLEDLIHAKEIDCDLERRSLVIHAYDAEEQNPLLATTSEGLTVHPLRLAHELARVLRATGIRIYEHSRVRTYRKGRAVTKQGSVAYQQVIVAAGTELRHPQIHRYVTTIGVTELLTKEQLASYQCLFLDERITPSFFYGRPAPDGRLLVGYGDARTYTLGASRSAHSKHIGTIQRFLQQHGLPADLSYAWSAAYSLSSTDFPLYTYADGVHTVNGAGIQLGSIAVASYAAHKVMQQPHPLDLIWKTTDVS